jgi:hypothetical protein
VKVAVVCTLYRRPAATRRMLAALSECYHSREIPCFLSCDYDPNHDEACSQVVAIAQDWAMTRRGRTEMVVNDPKRGIDCNKLYAIPAALESTGADAVILLEDDTGLSHDALSFFCTNLAATAADPSVLAVCGYNRLPDDNQGPEDVEAETALLATDLFSTYRFSGFKPWGWAMTAERFAEFFGSDGNGQRYKEQTRTDGNGMFDHWLTYQCQKQGRVTIRPLVGRTTHAEWADAEHTPSEQAWQERERVTVGAWLPKVELPDTGLFGWGKPVADSL